MQAAPDPLAIFFGDPHSHLSDVLYLYFRHYKRELIYRFFLQALNDIPRPATAPLTVADIGASMGFDMKYVFSRLQSEQPGTYRALVNLLEGDDHLIGRGEVEWSGFAANGSIDHRYLKCDLTEALPLATESQDIIVCSEVVEHLERPDALMREIYRALRPNGRFLLTTDNSPSAFQYARRIPVWLMGKYATRYRKPAKETEIASEVVIDGRARPIYAHINLNPTRYWERLARDAGFTIASFGTYESIRRGGGRKTPAVLAAYFGLGYLVSLLPRRLGRYFGDTTALLLKKKA